MQNIDDFIARWTASGGSEQANSQIFLIELCDALDLPRPEPAQPVNEENTYSFERKVYSSSDNGSGPRRLDLYKKGCFVRESKQSQRRDAGPVVSLEISGFTASSAPERGTRAWEDSMLRAKRQAENYIRCLPAKERRPPFLIVVDAGYCFDLYTEFSCTGGHYLHFPDPRRHRIILEDLVKPEVRHLFQEIWTDPLSLDPSLRAARVTEEVASNLATLARMLEADGENSQAVSQFLMRCIFSMFAESIGLLPSGSFTTILENSVMDVTVYPPLLRDLWGAMNFGQSASTLRRDLLQFDGGLFTDPEVLPLRREHLLILLRAATANWREVEPAIFGTLLERALDPKERHKLGAHYTPRAYVERLIIPALMDPLREDWGIAQAAASDFFRKGKAADARKIISNFHSRLRKTRVLDPACGSGNFLYVAMEHMMRLEAEVLQLLDSYGQKHPELQQIDPHQFLGLEINSRAAQIAEMVLWIGHLQWLFRTHGPANPPEPLIRRYGNIQQKDAVLEYQRCDFAVDANGQPIRRWDGETYKTDPVTGLPVPDLEAEVVDKVYNGAIAAKWPNADYVVGNPPFIGGKHKKRILGHGYFDALVKAYPMLPDSCDFVMYWWHKAAQLVRDGKVHRFGFITTNSISQVFNRRVMALHMESENPMHLSFAIHDHPWVNASDGAAVRIAMTVGAQGLCTGVLATVEKEGRSGGREFDVVLAQHKGVIHTNLRLGGDITKSHQLKSNDALCSLGVLINGSGFIVTPSQAKGLGLGRIKGLERHIRQYRNGKDLAGNPRGVMVIDLFGLTAEEVETSYPDVYQWVFRRVKPSRDANAQESLRTNWWLYSSNRPNLRTALAGLPRYICTIETSKHRFFTFLPAEVLPDNKLVVIASDDPYHLGVLSSRIHVCWALAAGARLVDRPVYVKSVCFDAFPFPNATPQQKRRIRQLAEKLDTHRKSRQKQHPDLTMTGLYNVLEAMRENRRLTATEKTIHENGMITVLGKLHDELDVAVADAYGWPVDLPDDDILEFLVTLNSQRAEDEKQGIRWLRPEYQTVDQAHRQKQSSLDIHEYPQPSKSHAPKTPPVVPAQKSDWPADTVEQFRAVRNAIASIRSSNRAVTPDHIAELFTHSPKKRIEEVLRVLEDMGFDMP